MIKPQSDKTSSDIRWSSLMAAAQDGDARSYATLLTECRPLIRRICANRLRDDAEVEDAVQDVLITVHMIRHTYDPSRPFRPWLIAIAERRAIDRSRTRVRRQRLEGAYAADPSTPTVSDPPMSDFLAEEQLRRALKSLPNASRTALGLTKIEELTLVEASQKTGMTVGALKVAVHRGLRTLRQRLGRKG